jgi:hypothetical protein
MPKKQTSPKTTTTKKSTATASKKSAPKPPRKKAVSKKATAKKTTITASKRHELISVAAYYKAAERGFAPDGAKSDWLAAELEIDKSLTAKKTTLAP